METVVNREAFLRALESAKPGLAQREIIEQSLCFVFTDGQVVTYNDEASCRGPSGLPRKFTGAVAAADLLEVLRRLEGDEVRVGADDDLFYVGVKGSQIQLALEADVRLPLAAVDVPGDYRPLHQDFGEALNLVQACAGKDESRFALTCVHVHPDLVEAGDNYQACRWRLRTGVKAPTLVKRSAVASAGTLGITELSEGENWVHFRNPRGFVLSCRRFVDEYPSADFDPFLAVKGEKITLPKQLKEACELANVFSQQNSDSNMVRIDVRPGQPGRVTVTGQGLTGKAKKSLPANWAGAPLSFLIPPALMGELVSRYNEVQLTDEVLKVDGGSYVYVSMLSPPESPEDAPKKKARKGDDDE